MLNHIFLEEEFDSFFFVDFLLLFLTVTLHFSFFLPIFAVITALPALRALSFPVFVTVTTFFLEDFHLIRLARFLLIPFTFSFLLCPTVMVIFVLLSLGFVAAFTWVAGNTEKIIINASTHANVCLQILRAVFSVMIKTPFII